MTHPDPQPQPGSRRFETRIDIRAPRDTVWEALATAEGLQRWFAPVATAEAVVGGEVCWQWAGHHRWVQRVEIVEPGRRLCTRYDSEVDDGAGGKRPLFVDFLLEGDGGVTSLRLVQSGFGPEADFDGEYDGIRRGWPVELRSLRLYCERHAGRDRQLAWSSLTTDLDAGEAWRVLTGPDGFRCGTAVESLGEGEPLAIVTADGDRFEGTALHCHARECSGVIEGHGGAFFRMSCERWGGQTHVWLWLGAYTAEAGALAALQARWDAMLSRLFGVAADDRAAGAEVAR